MQPIFAGITLDHHLVLVSFVKCLATKTEELFLCLLLLTHHSSVLFVYYFKFVFNRKQQQQKFMWSGNVRNRKLSIELFCFCWFNAIIISFFRYYIHQKRCVLLKYSALFHDIISKNKTFQIRQILTL